MSPMMGPVVSLLIWCLLCGRLQSTEAIVFNPVLFFQKSFQDPNVQADANPCCYPTQFRANVDIIGVGIKQGYELKGSMNVDGKKLRAAMKMFFENPEGDSQTARQVLLFNPTNKTATAYTIVDTAQYCNYTTWNGTFDQLIDPCFNGAKSAGDLTIGFKDLMSDSLKVKSWVRNIVPEMTQTRFVSAKYCAPIMESVVFSQKPQQPTASTTSYYTDVTSKLDESDFLIPKFCSPKYGMATWEELGRILKTIPQAFLYNNNN